MTVEPLVSIIMPVFNVEEYVEQAVCSVLAQSYKNFELLIIDDGSTDETSNTVGRLAVIDSRIKYIRQVNSGNSVARNHGLDLANGEFIAFLDGDDFIDSNFIESSIRRALDDNAEVVVTDYVKFEGNVSSRITTGIRFFDSYTAIWNKIYSERLWRDIRFPKGLKIEDLEVTPVLLLAATRVIKNNEAVYCYRVRGESITNSSGSNYHSQIIPAISTLLDNISKLNVMPKKIQDRDALLLFINRQIYTHCFFAVAKSKSRDLRIEVFNSIYSFLRQINIKEFGRKEITYSSNRMVNYKDRLIISLFKRHLFRLAILVATMIHRD